MTKFGWLVLLGIMLLIAGIAAIIYATFFNKHDVTSERPDAVQEIILPPVDETAATATETPQATSTVIH